MVVEPRLTAVVRTQVDGEPLVVLPGQLTDQVLDLARALLSAEELAQLLALAGGAPTGAADGSG